VGGKHKTVAFREGAFGGGFGEQRHLAAFERAPLGQKAPEHEQGAGRAGQRLAEYLGGERGRLGALGEQLGERLGGGEAKSKAACCQQSRLGALFARSRACAPQTSGGRSCALAAPTQSSAQSSAPHTVAGQLFYCETRFGVRRGAADNKLASAKKRRTINTNAKPARKTALGARPTATFRTGGQFAELGVLAEGHSVVRLVRREFSKFLKSF